MEIKERVKSLNDFVRRVKILVVDDDKTIRDTVCGMLECIGFEAGFAKDGTEAINLYKQAMKSKGPFDAVIMDLTIPNGMGGKETIKEFVKIEPGIRAIVSSGNCDDSAMTNPAKHGFSAALPKPYTIEELREVLHKVLTIHRVEVNLP